MFVPGHKPRAEKLEDMHVLLWGVPRLPKSVIVATVGPASFSPKPEINLLEEMVHEGMNMVRINLAHATSGRDREYVLEFLEALEQVIVETREPVAVIADLPGPRIRLGKVGQQAGEHVELEKGDVLTLTVDEGFDIERHDSDKEGWKFSLLTDGIQLRVYEFEVGSRATIGDGDLELTIVRCQADGIVLQAENKGTLRSYTRVYFPGMTISETALGQRDVDLLDWMFNAESGIARDKIDYVSLPSVKCPEDVIILKQILTAKYDQEYVKVLSSIETLEAVAGYQTGDYSAFESIVEVSDGILIARGELGIQVPFEDVPAIQRELIRRTHRAKKPAIVATHMLEHMIAHPAATRAEVTDVTNAILEGADATMLSGETSVGISPVGAVRAMRIITQKALERVQPLLLDVDPDLSDRSELISIAAIDGATRLKAKAIVTFSFDARIPIYIGHKWPSQPVFAIADNPDTISRLVSYRGIHPILTNYGPKNLDEQKQVCRRVIQDRHVTQNGDLLVVVLDPRSMQKTEGKEEEEVLSLLWHGPYELAYFDTGFETRLPTSENARRIGHLLAEVDGALETLILLFHKGAQEIHALEVEVIPKGKTFEVISELSRLNLIRVRGSELSLTAIAGELTRKLEEHWRREE